MCVCSHAMCLSQISGLLPATSYLCCTQTHAKLTLPWIMTLAWRVQPQGIEGLFIQFILTSFITINYDSDVT